MKKSGASSRNKENPGNRHEPLTVWGYKIPENIYPDNRVVNDTTYTFCNKCGRWKSCGIQHSSYYHKTKEEMIKLKYSSVNFAPTHDENPPGGGSLHITGNLFWGSVHKTPGNEVAYNRDSNSYSGAEYSCSPT